MQHVTSQEALKIAKLNREPLLVLTDLDYKLNVNQEKRVMFERRCKTIRITVKRRGLPVELRQEYLELFNPTTPLQRRLRHVKTLIIYYQNQYMYGYDG